MMKCSIPEISWHNREPILSVDLQPVSSDFYRLASGGGDCHVLIWQMVICDNGAVKVEVISDLTRHQRAVNSVRWSPTGQYLATADDDANIIVWQLKTDNIPLLEGNTTDRETWLVFKVLRGHKEDIYDLCWSTNGMKLFSGSVDNTAILWDLNKGKMDHILSDHKGFVQGVAWDPKNQFIASISTDRICRLFDCTGKQVKTRIYKGQLPVKSGHYLHQKEVKFFHDDTFKSFFRRLQFSPDGSLLIVPSGHFEVDDCKNILNATLVFTMDSLTSPVAILPHIRQSSTVVRCCPILFELRETGPDPLISLPYRIIIAVGTDRDVIVYDTQQIAPFACFHDIHYTRLTDLTWSKDGLLLIASSTDGFCALITFEQYELGREYVKKEVDAEENALDVSGCEWLEKDENVDSNNKDRLDKEVEKVKKPSFLEQWAAKSSKKVSFDNDSVNKSGGDVTEVSQVDEDDGKPKEKKINRLVPKRLAPTKVSNLEAKPIEVRRKPRKAEEVIETTKIVTTAQVHKPEKQMYVKICKLEDEQCNSKVSGKKLDTTETEDNVCALAEPLSFLELKLKDKAENSLTADAKTTPVKKTATKTPTQDKKAKTPTTKATTVKRKAASETTPVQAKKNPLLNFLKSAEKSKKTEKKSRPPKEMNFVNVDLTMDENEARDAWKCEKENESSDKIVETMSPPAMDVDDGTEDFCLQLEDTQPSEKGCGSQENVECESGVKSEKASNDVGENGKDELPERSNNVDTKSLTDSIAKIPRRVALITIASPKGKKLEKP